MPDPSIPRDQLLIRAYESLGGLVAAARVVEKAYDAVSSGNVVRLLGSDAETQSDLEAAVDFFVAQELSATKQQVVPHQELRRNSLGRESPDLIDDEASELEPDDVAGDDLTDDDLDAARRAARIRKATMRIRFARRRIRYFQAQIDRDVAILRRHEVSWSAIGRVLGVTAQSAHKRYKSKLPS